MEEENRSVQIVVVVGIVLITIVLLGNLVLLVKNYRREKELWKINEIE